MDYKADVRLIKALADENRLAVLRALQGGENVDAFFWKNCRLLSQHYLTT